MVPPDLRIYAPRFKPNHCYTTDCHFGLILVRCWVAYQASNSFQQAWVFDIKAHPFARLRVVVEIACVPGFSWYHLQKPTTRGVRLEEDLTRGIAFNYDFVPCLEHVPCHSAHFFKFGKYPLSIPTNYCTLCSRIT